MLEPFRLNFKRARIYPELRSTKIQESSGPESGQIKSRLHERLCIAHHRARAICNQQLLFRLVTECSRPNRATHCCIPLLPFLWSRIRTDLYNKKTHEVLLYVGRTALMHQYRTARPHPFTTAVHTHLNLSQISSALSSQREGSPQGLPLRA